MCSAFQFWGKPKSIRVDNGKPLGDPQRKSLPVLCLWLESIDIKVIYNRPRRPTDNAKVERMQRTTKNWAEIHNCENHQQLNQQLQKACLIQREKFKVSRLKYKTRKEYYPDLYTNSRVYSPDEFNPKNAYERLAKWTFARRTSPKGQFSLYNNLYYIGTKFNKEYISIQFDSEKIQWIVFDSKGNFIKSFKAINFSHENIRNLTACQRTYKKAQT